MARQVGGAWYRKGTDSWYATVEGKAVALGVKGKAEQKEAQQAWHRLMANPTPKPEPKHDDMPLTFREIADAFLAEASGRLKPPTIRLYRSHLASACKQLGTITASAINAQHLSHWLYGLKQYSGTTRGLMLRAVSACFGWAEQHEMLPANPAKKVPKPKSRSRSSEAIISEAEHQKMLALASPVFRPMLAVLHATGCRPGELCRMTAESFNAEASCVILHEHKSDSTEKPRIIFLPPDALSVLKAQAERFKHGALFRTSKGKAWSVPLLNRQIRRLGKRIGIKAMPYGYRHTFATDALARGVPDATVAALLGHSSTAMLHKHYSHLTSRASVLREAIQQVRA